MLSLVENLFKKNPLQDLLSSVNDVISTNERIEFIKGHMTYTVKRDTTHSKEFAGNQGKHQS